MRHSRADLSTHNKKNLKVLQSELADNAGSNLGQ